MEGHPNPEVGHYFERAWVAIFDPIPEKCLYNGSMSFHFGGKYTRKNKHNKRKRNLKRKNTKKPNR